MLLHVRPLTSGTVIMSTGLHIPLAMAVPGSVKTFYSRVDFGRASFSCSSAPFCHWPASLGNPYRPHPVQDHNPHSEKSLCRWAHGGGGVLHPDLHWHSPESFAVASKNISLLFLM